MKIVARDFNTFDNEIGDIVLYLSNNNKICVNILNLHDLGQAWMYIKYRPEIDLYNTFLNIMNKITDDLFNNNDIPIYKDIVSVEDEPIENIYYDSRWENYVEFTRESIMLLEEYNSDREDENKYSGIYISKGEILENGDFIYDKPIRNNSYYQDGMNRYDMY
jgi:hypothetical protein